MIIDCMGDRSSKVIFFIDLPTIKAQGLKTTITSYMKFAGTTQRLYIKLHENKVAGILKTGEKKLFYRDGLGKCKEMTPLCVLDFYVHEDLQRCGYGKELFEKMLEYEQEPPAKIAYDRPSPKLIGFLRKHYG